MPNKDDLLDTIAKALARIETTVAENGTKLDRVERSVSELKLATSELKRDTGRLILRVGDLEDAVRSEQEFTSDLYDQHEKRIGALEASAT